jgi:pyruvate,water dikinase
MNIAWLKQIGKSDIGNVGGKAANLGELIKAGVNVPDGFVITSSAYSAFLTSHNLKRKIQRLLKNIDPENSKILHKKALLIQKLILSKRFSSRLNQDIKSAYQKLGRSPLVAVRSSATAEDLKDASFAGQQKTLLNIQGEKKLLKAVKQTMASLFEARAIYYRTLHNFDHLKAEIAIIVQKMVRAEKAGVLFTINPLNNHKDELMIEAGLGLGEPIVSGSVTPDQYIVDKKKLTVLKADIQPQAWQMKFRKDRSHHISLTSKQKRSPKLTLHEIKALGFMGKKIEQHFKIPQDCEWTIEKNLLFFVQSRPITTLNKNLPGQGFDRQAQPAQYSPAPSSKGSLGKELLHGIAGSAGIGSGPVKIIHNPSQINKIKRGDTLVTEMTNPSFVPAMRKSAAIVTDTGGATSHAAIVSREMGIPAVVGTGQATHILRNRQLITVDGTKGVVYQGIIKVPELIRSHGTDLSPQDYETPIIGTKIYVNLAEPSLAKKVAQLPTDGVGLLRAEFMIAEIGQHPKALVKAGKADRYVESLEEGMRKISASFSPRPVIYRTTDFKTNEYQGLKGGKKYEPQEENPMLGYRGAFRYLAEPDMFLLELKALLKAREKYGLDNLHLMIPFVRTVEELKQTLGLIRKAGLKQGPDFRIWMMVEIPSNVLLIDQFLACGIDGVSIGSNDLTQLILGVDRDSSQLTEEFDERDPAILKAMTMVLERCKKKHITTSICGNAPSVYPEITEMLVRNNITSISVTPDMVIPTRKLVASVEKRILLEKYLE